MEVKLIVLGKKPGQEISLPGPSFVIGRQEGCQLRPRSEMVSRRHCEIIVDDGYVGVRDLGSKNGTVVNGEVIPEERELKNGDHLKVGPLEFEVQLVVSVSGKKKPKVRSVQEAAARTVQSGAGDDVDISGWLQDDDEADDTVNNAKRTVSQPKPAARRDGPADATPPKPHDQAAGETAQQKKDEDTQVVNRFRDDGKPKAESSRSAAADMLKQFFQHRMP